MARFILFDKTDVPFSIEDNKIVIYPRKGVPVSFHKGTNIIKISLKDKHLKDKESIGVSWELPTKLLNNGVIFMGAKLAQDSLTIYYDSPKAMKFNYKDAILEGVLFESVKCNTAVFSKEIQLI